jgi:hypothetical protein
MNGRIRFLAALLALVSFTAYFAEGVVASSCLPAGDVAADARAATVSHEGRHHPSPGPGTPESDMPQHCPLGMASGSSCVVPATLPSAASATGVPAAEIEPNVTTVADAAHDAFVPPLFHPPRA